MCNPDRCKSTDDALNESEATSDLGWSASNRFSSSATTDSHSESNIEWPHSKTPLKKSKLVQHLMRRSPGSTSYQRHVFSPTEDKQKFVYTTETCYETTTSVIQQSIASQPQKVQQQQSKQQLNQQPQQQPQQLIQQPISNTILPLSGIHNSGSTRIYGRGQCQKSLQGNVTGLLMSQTRGRKRKTFGSTQIFDDEQVDLLEVESTLQKMPVDASSLKSHNTQEATSNKKEEVVKSHTEDDNSTEAADSQALGNLLLKPNSVERVEVTLLPKTIGVGSFLGAAIRPILLSEGGIYFYMESVDGSHKFCIHPYEIIQCLSHFNPVGQSMIFFVTTSGCAVRIRKDLGIKPQTDSALPAQDPYFDPKSKELAHQLITVVLGTVNDNTKADFTKLMELYKETQVQTPDDQSFYMELNEEEAYEVYKQSCKTKPVGINMSPAKNTPSMQLTHHAYFAIVEDSSCLSSPVFLKKYFGSTQIFDDEQVDLLEVESTLQKMPVDASSLESHNTQEVTSNKKDEVKSHTEDDNSTEAADSQALGNLLLKPNSAERVEVTLLPKTIRVGSFIGAAIRPILLSEGGIYFYMESVDGSHKFCIHPYEIIQCLSHFNPVGQSMIFFVTTSGCAVRIRKDLGIKPQTDSALPAQDPYFDPKSKEEAHQLITVVLGTVNDNTKADFTKLMELYKETQVQTPEKDDQSFYMELNEEEACQVYEQCCKKKPVGISLSPAKNTPSMQLTHHAYFAIVEDSSCLSSPVFLKKYFGSTQIFDDEQVDLLEVESTLQKMPVDASSLESHNTQEATSNKKDEVKSHTEDENSTEAADSQAMSIATNDDEAIVSSMTEKNEDCGETAISGDKGGARPGRLLINKNSTPFRTGDGVPTSQKCIMLPDENGQMKMFIVPTEKPRCEENKVFIVAPLGQSSWNVKAAVGNERVLTSKSNQDDANNAKTVTSAAGTLSKVTRVHAGSSGSTKVSYPSKSGTTSSNSATHRDSALRSLLNEKPSNISTVKITEANNAKLVTSKPSTASIKNKVVTSFSATKIVMPDGRIFTTLLPSPGSASSLKTGDILTLQNGSNDNILVRQSPASIPVATTVTTSSALNMGTSLLNGISVASKTSAVVTGLSKHTNESRELVSSHITSSDADPVSNSSVITMMKNVQVSSSPNTSAVSSEMSVPDVSTPEKPYPMLLFSHEAATRIGMKKTTDLLNSCDTTNKANTTNILSNQGHIMTSGNTSIAAITSQNQNFSQIGLTSIFSSVAQSSKTTNVNRSSVKPPQINCSTTRSPEVKVNTFPVLFVSNGTSAPAILVPATFVPPTPITQSQTTSPVIQSLIPSSLSVSQASKGASQIPSSIMMPPSTIKGLISMPSSVVPQVSKVTILTPSVTSSSTVKSLIHMPPSRTASQVSKVANQIPYVTVSTKGSTPIPATAAVSQVSRIVQNTNVLIPPSILSQTSQTISMPAYAYAKISAPQLTTATTPAKVQTVSWPCSTHPESILKTVAGTLPIYSHSAASSVSLNTSTSISRNSSHTASVENKRSEPVRDEIRIDSVFSLSHMPDETIAMTKEDMKSRKCDEKNEKEEDSSQTKVSSVDGSNSHAVSKKDIRNVLRLAISKKRAQGMEELNSDKSAESPDDTLKISGKKFRSISKRDVGALEHNSKTNFESLKELCKPCSVVLRKFHFRQTTVSAKYAAIYKTDRCRKNCREKALRNIMKKKRIVVKALHKAVTSVAKERKFVSDVKSQADKRSRNSVDEEESQDKDAGLAFSSRSTPVTNVDKVIIPNNQTDAQNSSQNSRSLLFSASTMISNLVEKVRKTDMSNSGSISKTYTTSPAPRSIQTPIVVTVGSSFPDRLSSAVSSSGSLPVIPMIVRLPTTTAIATSQASLSQSRFSSPSPAAAPLSVANSTSTILPIRPTLLMNQVTSGNKVVTLTNQSTQSSQTTGSTTVLTSQSVIAKPSTTVTDLRSTISQVFTPQASSNPITISPSPGQSLLTRLPLSGVMPSTVATKSTSGMQQRYYLIKVDNKNILIPANMSHQQPRAYVIPQKDSAVMPMSLLGKDSSVSKTKGNITLVSVLPTGKKANQNIGSVSLASTSGSGPTQGKTVNPPNTLSLSSSCPTVRVKSEPKTEGYGDEENTITRNESWIKKEPITSGYGDEGNSNLSSINQTQHQKEQVKQRSISGMGDSSGTKRKGLEDKDDRANRVKSMRLQSNAGEANVYSEVRGSEEEKMDGSSDTDTTSEISKHDGSKSLLTESGLTSHEDKIRRLKQLMQEKMKALEEFKRQRHIVADDNN